MDWKAIEYDVIVIGSGATGGIAAQCLADGGANVLILEAGPKLVAEGRGERDKSREEFEAFKYRQPVQSRSLLYNKKNCHLFIDDLDNPYATDSATEFNWIRSRQAGGRTLIWSKFALRMSEQDLDAGQDGAGGPWPISYGDLAPYYDKVEALIGVAGTAEKLPSLPDGCFLQRRVPSYLRTLRGKLGKRFPERHLIPSREATNEERPAILSLCDSTPAHPNTTFRANCIAAQIKLERPDHAKGVIFVDRESKRWYEVNGRVVLLCASTIESIRLLLASTSRHCPSGLGNSSGILGHYIMDHFGGPRMVAVGKIQNDAEPRSRERAYIPQFCNLGWQIADFVRGYGIQLDLEMDGHENSVATMAVFGEVLPYADNAVELDPFTKDAWGLAAPKISFRYRDNERSMALHAQTALREIADALGLRPMIVHESLLVAGTRAHELGGARMGSRPCNSVLNAFNQCWDVPNLFVTDGSCFPSAGYKAPTLTMMALTARACDRILEMLRDGAV